MNETSKRFRELHEAAVRASLEFEEFYKEARERVRAEYAIPGHDGFRVVLGLKRNLWLGPNNDGACFMFMGYQNQEGNWCDLSWQTLSSEALQTLSAARKLVEDWNAGRIDSLPGSLEG